MKVYRRLASLGNCYAFLTAFAEAFVLKRPRGFHLHRVAPQDQATTLATITNNNDKYYASPLGDIVGSGLDNSVNLDESTTSSLASSWMTTALTSTGELGGAGVAAWNNFVVGTVEPALPLFLPAVLGFVAGQAALKTRKDLLRKVVKAEMDLNRLRYTNIGKKCSPAEMAEALTDLQKLKKQVDTVDSFITTSFTGVSMSSALSLCVLLGAVDVPDFSGGGWNGGGSPNLVAVQQPQARMVTIKEPTNEPVVALASTGKSSSSILNDNDDALFPSSSSASLLTPAPAASAAATTMPKSEQEMTTTVAKLDTPFDATATAPIPSFMDTLISRIGEMEDIREGKKPEQLAAPSGQAPASSSFSSSEFPSLTHTSSSSTSSVTSTSYMEQLTSNIEIKSKPEEQNPQQQDEVSASPEGNVGKFLAQSSNNDPVTLMQNAMESTPAPSTLAAIKENMDDSATIQATSLKWAATAELKTRASDSPDTTTTTLERGVMVAATNSESYEETENMVDSTTIEATAPIWVATAELKTKESASPVTTTTLEKGVMVAATNSESNEETVIESGKDTAAEPYSEGFSILAMQRQPQEQGYDIKEESYKDHSAGSTSVELASATTTTSSASMNSLDTTTGAARKGQEGAFAPAEGKEETFITLADNTATAKEDMSISSLTDSSN